jgi:hypothetical protein
MDDVMEEGKKLGHEIESQKDFMTVSVEVRLSKSIDF